MKRSKKTKGWHLFKQSMQCLNAKNMSVQTGVHDTNLHANARIYMSSRVVKLIGANSDAPANMSRSTLRLAAEASGMPQTGTVNEGKGRTGQRIAMRGRAPGRRSTRRHLSL